MNRTTVERQQFEELLEIEKERAALEEKANRLRYALGFGLIPGTKYAGMARKGRPRNVDQEVDREVDQNEEPEMALEVRRDSLGRRITGRKLSAAARLKMAEGAQRGTEAQQQARATNVAKARAARVEKYRLRAKEAKQAAKRAKSGKPLPTGPGTGRPTRPADESAVRRRSWETRRANIAKAAKAAKAASTAKAELKPEPKPAPKRGEWTEARRQHAAERMRQVNQRLLTEGRHASQINGHDHQAEA